VQLDRLQNEVPPVPYEAARQVITGELGVPPEELYASFSPQPLAVASLEQVHHAVLADGTEVAVKVQRPSLDRQVHADLRVARLMGRYGERRSTWGLSVPFRPVDDRAFSRAFEHQMSRYDRGAGTDVKVVLSAAMGVLRDHGLRLDPQLTLALKALAQSSAFFTQPAPPGRTFTEAALDAATELAEETFAGEYLAEIAKKRGIRLASRAIQEAPDYSRDCCPGATRSRRAG
jgi:hypothetical protein